MSNNSYRVRFAPSPTGNPHVGNFRAALYNYLFARHHGGAFLLRIEDTDKARSTPESVNAILESLQWMGLEWDGDPYFQSQHISHHHQEVQRLLDEGKAYRCRCKPEDLEARRQQQIAEKQNPKYDGRCRNENYPDDGVTPFCVRLKSPMSGVTNVHDEIRGEVVVQNEELDDLILLRTDGSPTYNLAVVVDDHDMGITHVIRGDDHLNNTIRQVAIYQALGYELPIFAHLPQILGPDKTRLSKRHGATGVLEYREKGYLPEAMINYLARLGWSHGDQEFFTKQELIDLFTLDHINKSAAIFDPQKFEWLSGEHIRHLSIEDLANRFINFMVFKGYLDTEFCNDENNIEFFIKIAECTRERSKTLEEMREKVSFIWTKDITYPEKDAPKILTPEAAQGLQDLLDFAENQGNTPPSHDQWEQAFAQIMENRGLKMKIMAQAVRLALTGTKVSPPIFHVIELLGLNEVKRRLKLAIEHANHL